MSGTLRQIQAGWLLRSIEGAKRHECENRAWVVRVRENVEVAPSPVASSPNAPVPEAIEAVG